MRIMELALEDFRSYERIRIPLSHGITAFVGPNGQGKTNLLEAVHLLARGDSPRAREDPELVRWGAVLARAAAVVQRDGEDRRVEILLFSPPPGERRRPRRYLVNGAGRRAEDALGEIVVVAFFPEDVDLLTAAPSARRRYLDAMLSQAERAHRSDTRALVRVLEQRNALLRALASPDRPPTMGTPAGELAFWDAELCRLAAAIATRRSDAVARLREGFERATRLFADAGGTTVSYECQVSGATSEEREAGYRRLLGEKRDQELWRGTTLVGPHREDLLVTRDRRALGPYASRGEQRSAVLALKIAEATWLRDRTGSDPVFLLDDVLSELDDRRREVLIGALPADAQTLLTAALPAGLPKSILAAATVVPVPVVA